MNATEIRISHAQMVEELERCYYEFDENASLEEILAEYERLTGHTVRVVRMTAREFKTWMQKRYQQLEKTIHYYKQHNEKLRDENYYMIMGSKICYDYVDPIFECEAHMKAILQCFEFTYREYIREYGWDCELAIPMVGKDAYYRLATIVNEVMPASFKPWNFWPKHPHIYRH